jgi:dolichyl-phosphate-mannose--protein O-mannosyl transferase
VAETGCQIGLNWWYVFLTGLVCVKLLIEIFRYISVKVNYQESVALHFGGNFLLMPIAFAVFFVHTQTMWEHSNPDPDHVMSFHEA